MADHVLWPPLRGRRPFARPKPALDPIAGKFGERIGVPCDPPSDAEEDRDVPVAPARHLLLAATLCGVSGTVMGLAFAGHLTISLTLFIGLTVGAGLGLWIARVAG